MKKHTYFTGGAKWALWFAVTGAPTLIAWQTIPEKVVPFYWLLVLFTIFAFFFGAERGSNNTLKEKVKALESELVATKEEKAQNMRVVQFTTYQEKLVAICTSVDYMNIRGNVEIFYKEEGYDIPLMAGCIEIKNSSGYFQVVITKTEDFKHLEAGANYVALATENHKQVLHNLIVKPARDGGVI